MENNTICSITNDTLADSIMKQPKIEQMAGDKPSTFKAYKLEWRAHTPTAKNEPDLRTHKEDDQTSNYFQKAIGTHIVKKGHNNYTRCYKNRSLSSNKNAIGIIAASPKYTPESGVARQVGFNMMLFLNIFILILKIRIW